MRFKALPVTSLEDATVDLEQLQGLLTKPVAALSFLQLAGGAGQAYIDGPHNFAVAGLTAGSGVASTFSTTRLSWSNAVAVGSWSPGSATNAAPTQNVLYVSGATWQVSLGNPWTFALPAGQWTGYVIGI